MKITIKANGKKNRYDVVVDGEIVKKGVALKTAQAEVERIHPANNER